MRNLSENLKNREIKTEKLKNYGFKQNNDEYTFTKIINSNFQMIVKYSDDTLTSRVIDCDTGEDYVIVDLDKSIGKYAAELKTEYEKNLKDILDNCSQVNIYKTDQSKRIMTHIEDEYSCELEFLWKRFPTSAIYRNNNNRKWFAVMQKVSQEKLGLEGDGELEILNVKHDNVEKLLDYKNILEGYHMSKKHWISIPLDERVSDGEIIRLVKNSYELVK